MKAKIISLIVLAMMFVAAREASASRINYPKWHGYALDWCADFERSCGKPAADMYCMKFGYGPSTGFQIWPTVSFQTMTIGQNAICDPSSHRCDSFLYIDCQDKARTFSYPMYNGYRLDWCRQFETNCGAPAALAFCQKNGFANLVNFAEQPHLSTPTMTIGSNAICNPSFHTCDSFSYVRCGN